MRIADLGLHLPDRLGDLDKAGRRALQVVGDRELDALGLVDGDLGREGITMMIIMIIVLSPIPCSGSPIPFTCSAACIATLATLLAPKIVIAPRIALSNARVTSAAACLAATLAARVHISALAAVMMMLQIWGMAKALEARRSAASSSSPLPS